jgi:Tol biopolymer transport system component
VSPSATPPTVSKQLAIAVASGSATNGISVIGSSGQVKQLVAPHGGPVSDLAWSPDGIRLAYGRAVSISGYVAQLWVYDTSTGKASQIVFPNEDRAVVVDGFTWVGATRLVASVIGSGPTYYWANGTLWLCDVQNGSLNTVKDASGHILRGANPTASADGTLVAFVHYGKKTGFAIPEQLLLYHADTLAVSEVTHGKAYADGEVDAFSFPKLSPDGSLVYACQTGGGPGFQCVVYRVDGAKVYSGPALATLPNGAWDANSARLAFIGTSSRDGLYVWSVGSAKAKTMALQHGSYVARVVSLAWTPLGKQIVYTVPSASAPNGDIWVVNADGTNKHRLLHNGSYPACAEAPIEFP